MIEEITLEDGRILSVERQDRGNLIEISFRIKADEGCILHWGLTRSERAKWQVPPERFWPPESMAFGPDALQTPLRSLDGEVATVISLDRAAIEDFADMPSMVAFVLFFGDSGRWDNNGGKNYYFRLRDVPVSASYIVREIVEAEMGDHSWSLMHRFNLCHDLAESVAPDAEGLALLFVWLRYSALRQLDWQRRYNTKPRELSHSQDRLTLKFSELYVKEPKGRGLIRMLMGTVGKGGDGQRIRDEILNIMHRHRIKEVSGHFLEEWHQKLHNNATPDDIAICEAYLGFLRSGGDLGTFYKTLESGGVTKERLESFDRPIVAPPDFIPHLKDALIYDFGQFLKVLKAVHSATDLESAAGSAGYLLDGSAAGLLSFILRHRDDRTMSPVELANGVAGLRGALAKLLGSEKDSGKVRVVLYLDLALEDFLRVLVERGISKWSADELVELTNVAIKNLRFSHDSEEFAECSRHWQSLRDADRFTPDWSLRVRAVIERLTRAIWAQTDGWYRMLQPRAELLGKAFHADSWSITLFSEEVVRGMPAFVLSLLIRRLEPVLRRIAKLGDWQIVSPGRATGKVEVFGELRDIAGIGLDAPTVAVVEAVKGDEELPPELRAVISQNPVDLVSHVSVRARNAGLLFAVCHDPNCFNRLKAMRGQVLSMSVGVSGDVVYEEAGEEGETRKGKFSYAKLAPPKFSAYAITRKDFAEDLVGRKSYGLRLLEGMLPEWIALPHSVAVPFGVFEEVLYRDENSRVARRHAELLGKLKGERLEPSRVLSEIRERVLELELPEEFLAALQAVMREAAIAWPESKKGVSNSIKQVWASKWNDRAYLSRRGMGVPEEDVFMAVLIQQVIKSEYAFVIHTVNPISGDRGELYAEVVPGLGETLVGNYPGRAFGFKSKKDVPEPQATSYPSKSTGLYGGNIIFRSDSNMEDLPGYSAAGLYDSIMLPQPHEVTLSYTNDALVADEGFRVKLLTGIAHVGIEVERAAGSPQDVEGVYAGGRFYVVQSRPQVGLDV